MKDMSIMFVCTGNICRSPLAHTVLEHMAEERGLKEGLFIESSGTGAWHVGEKADPRMRQVALNHGIRITHRSKKLRYSDIADFDLILVMDQHNFQDTLALCRDDEERKKVRLFRDYDTRGEGDVPDPWYGGMEGFEEVWSIVHRVCENLIGHILSDTLI